MKYVSVLVVGIFLVFGFFTYVVSQPDIDTAQVRFESKQFGTAELAIKKK